jgi:hypothetical protein
MSEQEPQHLNLGKETLLFTNADQMENYCEFYAVLGFRKAFEKIEELANPNISNKETCRCRSCMHTAVRDVNAWIDFFDKEEAHHYRYQVLSDPKTGKLSILTPMDQIEVVLEDKDNEEISG